MEKPKEPKEPNFENYPIPQEPNGKNYLGEPIYQRIGYLIDYKKFQKELNKYKADMEIYKLIK